MSDSQDYLFEKVFFQSAHIAILEELIDTLEKDIQNLHEVDVANMLIKITIARAAVERSKKGMMK